jgi:hypothetical protein
LLQNSQFERNPNDIIARFLAEVTRLHETPLPINPNRDRRRAINPPKAMSAKARIAY